MAETDLAKTGLAGLLATSLQYMITFNVAHCFNQYFTHFIIICILHPTTHNYHNIFEIQEWTHSRDQLIYLRELGEGQFGKVLLMNAKV